MVTFHGALYQVCIIIITINLEYQVKNLLNEKITPYWANVNLLITLSMLPPSNVKVNVLES